MDQESPRWYRRPFNASIEETLCLVKRWHGAGDGLIEIAVTPRFAITCSPELLEAAGAIARAHSLVVHTHLNETRDEIDYTGEVHDWWSGIYTGLYRQQGVISDHGRPIVLAHQIHVGNRELGILDDFPVLIAHCPASNFALRSGAAKFDFWKVYGGGARKVGIGSDVGGAPWLDLADQVRHTMYLNDPGFNIYQAWYLATLGGAEGLRLSTGALMTGREADFLLLDLRAVNPGIPDWPVENLEERLMLIASRGAGQPLVSETYVRGRRIFDRREEI
jgi:guanine deaminase